MIEVTLSSFFAWMFLLVAILAGLGVGWDQWQVRRAARAVRRVTVRCRICGTVYRATPGRDVQQCPECRSPGQPGPDRRLG